MHVSSFRMRCFFRVALSLLPLIGVAQSTPLNGPLRVPDWAYPLNPPEPAHPRPLDSVKPLHIPDSKVAFTEAQLNDLFTAPDWRPGSHSAMPKVVAYGNAPDVYACGFCHTPSGQGRPENASLAGLPVQYILQQVADFKNGARRSAWLGPYRPTDRMIGVAMHATTQDVMAAAEYFSAQRLKPRVVVMERSRVPRHHVVGWLYAADEGGGDELLGERLLEFAPDVERHEHRDDQMRYVAYVPVGSIARGKSLAQSGSSALAAPCVTCHGQNLQGVGLIPPIAGRSPSYLLRQLLAFKTGARTGTTAQPMNVVVTNLQLSNMIDVAAYAGSLQP
jgi:cytochrome c553